MKNITKFKNECLGNLLTSTDKLKKLIKNVKSNFSIIKKPRIANFGEYLTVLWDATNTKYLSCTVTMYASGKFLIEQFPIENGKDSSFLMYCRDSLK